MFVWSVWPLSLPEEPGHAKNASVPDNVVAAARKTCSKKPPDLALGLGLGLILHVYCILVLHIIYYLSLSPHAWICIYIYTYTCVV